MKPYIFLVALSVLLSSCSPKNEQFTEFSDVSEIEAFIEGAISEGDGASFFEAVDTSNIPEAIVSDIENTLKDVFKSLKTAERTDPKVMTFAEFTEYRIESRKEWPEWIRENMKPLSWNYQPTKVILYKFGKEENMNISAGIVERDGKLVLVSSYLDQPTGAANKP
jgi:superfamily I DNA and/or RNA helicase